MLTDKIGNSVGNEADYVFKIIPFVKYDIGSVIIFEFSITTDAKFNKAGHL